MSIVVRLEQQGLDPSRELGALIEQSSGTGAAVSFVGVARPRSTGGRRVDRLVLEHHPTLTQQSLDGIASEAADRFDVADIWVVHRCGEVAAGEPVVFAGAASLHRRAAFDAVDYLMDRLKTDAVLWKREVGENGSEWIEATDGDHSDRERWG